MDAGVQRSSSRSALHPFTTNRPRHPKAKGLSAACLGSVLLVGAAALPGLAQVPPTTTNAAAASAPAQVGTPGFVSAGLANDWLRHQSQAFEDWDFGGQVRTRFEHKENFAVPSAGQVDFERAGDADNTYWLFRERVHLGWAPCSWFRPFAEMQDSAALNDDRNPSPDDDHFQLRQASLTFGAAKEFPLTLKAGRQELIYGDQRLVGVADWLNIGRTFDAVKLHYEVPEYWIDGFVSQPVIPDKHEFDESDSRDRLSGIYASTRSLVRFQETQFYFLARNVDEHPAAEPSEKLYPLASPRDIYTLGARVKSLPLALGGWDYEAEWAGQLGRFKASNTSPSLDHQAVAAHVAGGYTWTEVGGSPRLGLEFNYASGDSNSADGKHQTFDNLFPSNHGLYGIMDFFSWQNMYDVHPSVSVRPVKDLVLRLDGHAFWLANTHDSFYQGNGTPRSVGGYGIHSEFGSFVGTELDLVAAWKISRYASVQAGYANFFTGDYPRDSLAGHGGATDAHYLYAQLYFNF